MRIHVLKLTTGDCDKHTFILASHCSPVAAESDRARRMEHLHELVRKYKLCDKLCQDFYEENPPPSMNVCTCSAKSTERCAACEGWNTVFKLAQEEICKQERFNPVEYYPLLHEGFSLAVEETELYGTVFDHLA